MDTYQIDPLSAVHIKDRSVRLASKCRWQHRVANRQLTAQLAAAYAESLRGRLDRYAQMRGTYSPFHNRSVCLTAFWQSVADAKDRNAKENVK